MALFEIPKVQPKEKVEPKIKLKRGQTVYTLIEQAEKLVKEKLGKYIDTRKCITDISDLKHFFDTTDDDGIIRNRYRNNRIKYISR